eukprot:scaffold288686_cov22-Tisochrysis_lutea.AAC.1
MGCTGMESNQRQAGCWGEGWALFGRSDWGGKAVFAKSSVVAASGEATAHLIHSNGIQLKRCTCETFQIKRTVPEPLTIPHCIGPLAVSATLGAHLDSKG